MAGGVLPTPAGLATSFGPEGGGAAATATSAAGAGAPSAGAGSVHRLRDFWASPGSGVHGRARWQQTMGSLTLRLQLAGAPWEGASASEFCVRLCERGLRVTNARRPEASDTFLLDSLNGDFHQEVLVGSSWWTSEVGDVDRHRGQLALVVHLAKARDGSWPAPFREGPLAAPAALSADWKTLPECRGALGQESEVDIGLRRDDLLEELVVEQTEDLVTLRLLLKSTGLEKARRLTPMSRMFGMDLTQDSLRIFLRGPRGATLASGTLGGRIAPEQTDWSIVKVTREVAGATGSRASARETRPALSVQLRKASDCRGEWEEVFAQDGAGVPADDQSGGPESRQEEAPRIDALDEDADAVRKLELADQAQTPEDLAKAFKAKGDECFKRRQWDAAVGHYTSAMAHAPDGETLLANRSAAYVELGQYQLALDDAMRAAEVAPAWPKPLFRQGVALRSLKRYDMALSAFAEGLVRDAKNPNWQREIDATEELKAARQAARAAKRR